MLGRGAERTDALPVFYSTSYCSNLRKKKLSPPPSFYEIDKHPQLCSFFFFTGHIKGLWSITCSPAGPSCREQQAHKESKTERKKKTRMIKHTHKPCKYKGSSSCLFMSVQCPTIWRFGSEPMQSDRETGQRWWELSSVQDGRHTMSHTLRCCTPCHRNKHIRSCSNQLVPLELLTRRAEHKGL